MLVIFKHRAMKQGKLAIKHALLQSRKCKICLFIMTPVGISRKCKLFYYLLQGVVKTICMMPCVYFHIYSKCVDELVDK